MLKKITLLLTTMLLFGFVHAQNKKIIRCATDEYYQNQIANNPSLKQSYDAAAQQTRAIANTIVYNAKGKSGNSAPQYIIPVVVHVLYNKASENLADSTVYTNLQRLNDDFRRTNFDTANTRSIFKGIAADTKIEFRLAVRDPNGNCTNGIIHKFTSATSFNTTNKMKSNATNGDDPWPTGAYLNLWVCTISGGILGYAQFPGGTAATDGVVIDNGAFGQKGAAQAPYDLGRTLTHEVGHWLNLYHTFQGGCTGMTAANCASSNQGDECCDTPPTSAANYGCPGSQNTCNESYSGNRVDMTENYMDYTDDACMNAFTIDQAARMQATLMGVRNGLITSLALTPVPSQTPIITLANDTICNGGSVTLTASGANTYFWTPSTGLSSNSNATVIASPTVTTTYTVYSTNTTNNCTGWTQDTIMVIGTAKSISVSPLNICLGTPQTLTASGGSNFTWSPSTGISNSIHDTVTAYFTTNSIYTITSHDTIGGVACTASKNFRITVNTPPTISSNKTAVCNGKATNVTVSGATNYLWSPSNGLNTTTAGTVAVTITSPTTYTIIGTNSTTGCKDTIQVPLAINALPVVTANANSNILCQGTSTQLNANGASTYTWSPSTNLSSSSGAAVNATPNQTITYTVTGTSTATGCSNTATTTITINPKPIADYTYTAVIAGNSTFTSNITASTYYWEFGDGTTSTAMSPSHTFNADGNYTVCLTITDNNNCTDSVCKTISVNNVGIDNPNTIFSQLVISPNPFTEGFSIHFADNSSSPVSVTIFDIMGRKITEQKINTISLLKHTEFKTADFAKGIYLVEIKNNTTGVSITKKIFKN